MSSVAAAVNLGHRRWQCPWGDSTCQCHCYSRHRLEDLNSPVVCSEGWASTSTDFVSFVYRRCYQARFARRRQIVLPMHSSQDYSGLIFVAVRSYSCWIHRYQVRCSGSYSYHWTSFVPGPCLFDSCAAVGCSKMCACPTRHFQMFIVRYCCLYFINFIVNVYSKNWHGSACSSCLESLKGY